MDVVATFLGIGSLREVGQAVVSGVIAGASYGLLGAAFALILGVTGRFHFAFASAYTVAAFLASIAAQDWGLPLFPAVLVGLGFATLFAVLIEAVVYHPLAQRAGEGAMLPVFVASLGVVIATENVLRLGWGSNTRQLPGFPEHTYTVADINFTLLDVTLVVVAALVLTGLSLLLTRTVLGQQIRAVRGNPHMALAVGVDVRRTFLIVFALGTVAAGVAAAFAGMKFAVEASMGNEPVFFAFVVAFLAGLHRSPLAVGAVGLAIGVTESVSTLWVSTNLSEITVFGLMFVFLAVRSVPSGIRQLSGALSRGPAVGGTRRSAGVV